MPSTTSAPIPSVRRSGGAWVGSTVHRGLFVAPAADDFGTGGYDEGLSLYGALRVFHGRLPYRDFWTNYGPGEFYLLAGCFRFFGIYAMWGRVVFLLTNTVSLLTIVYIFDELQERRAWSVGISFLVVVWISILGGCEFPVYPPLGLCSAAGASED